MIQIITVYLDVRSPPNHRIITACTYFTDCKINKRNLSTPSSMDIRRIKDAEKSKPNKSSEIILRAHLARGASNTVSLIIARSIIMFQVLYRHIGRRRRPWWSRCLLGSDAPCPLNMSLTDPIFFYYVYIMIIDRFNTDLVSIGVDHRVIYGLYQNKIFLSVRKTDFFS